MEVKRQLKRLAAGSAIVAAAAFANVGLAQADGMPERSRVVYESPWNWSGLYFGVHSGYSWSSYNNTFLTPGVASWSTDSDTGLVGGQIGLQHQWGQLVLGVEGDLSSAFKDQNNEVPCPSPATNCSGRFVDVITVGPRIGYAMGKWMPYVTGGYANAAFDAQATTKAANVVTVDAHDRTNGWYIGGGVDMALAHGWTIGLEYRHYDFNSFVSDRWFPGGAADPGDRSRIDTNLDTVSVRVSWKLGRPEAAPLK